MAVQLLMNLVGAIFDVFDAILPDIELDVSAELSEFADVVAGGIAWINGVLPLAELLDAIDWVLVVYLPFVLVFHLVKWIYAHLPVVGGGS